MSTTLLSRSDSFAGCRSEFETREAGDTLPQRFARSMVIDFKKWQNAIGYAIDLIREANADERNEIERTLIWLGVNDWRDVEALAALASPLAMDTLRNSLKNPELVPAILYYAPELAPLVK